MSAVAQVLRVLSRERFEFGCVVCGPGLIRFEELITLDEARRCGGWANARARRLQVAQLGHQLEHAAQRVRRVDPS